MAYCFVLLIYSILKEFYAFELLDVPTYNGNNFIYLPKQLGTPCLKSFLFLKFTVVLTCIYC